MNTICEQNDERLLALLLGELESGERREVEAHLATCERCRGEMDSLRSTVGRLQESFEAEASAPRLSEQRVEELKAGNVKAVPVTAPVRRINPARWGLMAAVALFGIVGVTALIREDSSPLQVSDVGFHYESRENETVVPSPAEGKKGDLKVPAADESDMLELNDAAALTMTENESPAPEPRSELYRAGERDVAEELAAAPMELRASADGDESVAIAAAKAPEAAEERRAAGQAGGRGLQGGNAPLRSSALEGAQSSAVAAGLEKSKEVGPARQLADASVGELRQFGTSEPGRPIGGIMPLPPGTPSPALRPSLPNDAEFDAMYFQNYGVNPFIDTAEDPRSTFAVDVDTASYTIVRNYLNRGVLPPPEAVRVEEFVNYFEADYPASAAQTFAVYSEVAPSPFREGYSLLRVGIKGREVPPRERKPVVLTFVVDVSGSMAREDRLGLVKRTLATLLHELRPGDRVGLAVYGSRGEEILSHHDVTEEGAIERGIARLQPGGSTNAEEGLRIGYAMARRAFDPGAVNRVILCTDGVANVGRTGAESILDVIGREANDRIYLTTLGFGLGNYNDVLLEQLADKGNGHYAYLDSDEEALHFIRRRLAGSMEVIAQDVKIQVELDAGAVRKYRLLGYENRDIADRDFRNDRVDAGEIGAGHAVTALYEVKLEERSESDVLGVVRLRFKDPEAGLRVREIEGRLDRQPHRASFEDAESHFQLVWIAAQFAEILRRSYWARDISIDELIGLLDETHLAQKHPEAAGLRDMMMRTTRLMPRERPEPLPMGSIQEEPGPLEADSSPRRADEVRMLEKSADDL